MSPLKKNYNKYKVGSFFINEKLNINNSPRQNCFNFFRYKLEINNKTQTFVKNLLLVSFDASVKLVTICKTNNLKINKRKLL